MNFIKKLAAGLLLSWGFICLVVAVSIFMTPKEKLTPQDRDAALGCLVLGLPPAVAGGWIVRGLYRKHKLALQAQEKAARDRLQATFFQLVEAGEGQITLLKFAKEAEITGEEAKQFLDEKAKEFNATFDVSEEGGIFYHFYI